MKTDSSIDKRKSHPDTNFDGKVVNLMIVSVPRNKEKIESRIHHISFAQNHGTWFFWTFVTFHDTCDVRQRIQDSNLLIGSGQLFTSGACLTNLIRTTCPDGDESCRL